MRKGQADRDPSRGYSYSNTGGRNNSSSPSPSNTMPVETKQSRGEGGARGRINPASSNNSSRSGHRSTISSSERDRDGSNDRTIFSSSSFPSLNQSHSQPHHRSRSGGGGRDHENHALEAMDQVAEGNAEDNDAGDNDDDDAMRSKENFSSVATDALIGKRKIGILIEKKDGFGFLRLQGVQSSVPLIFFHYSQLGNVRKSMLETGDFLECTIANGKKKSQGVIGINVIKLKAEQIGLERMTGSLESVNADEQTRKTNVVDSNSNSKSNISSISENDAYKGKSSAVATTLEGIVIRMPSGISKFQSERQKDSGNSKYPPVANNSDENDVDNDGLLEDLNAMGEEDYSFASASESGNNSEASHVEKARKQQQVREGVERERILHRVCGEIVIKQPEAESTFLSLAGLGNASHAQLTNESDTNILHWILPPESPIFFAAIDLKDPSNVVREHANVEFHLFRETLLLTSLSNQSSMRPATTVVRYLAKDIKRRVGSFPKNACLGKITSLKEHYGFIERSDVDEDVFFHYTEISGGFNPADLSIGDDVQFTLRNRANKWTAFNVQVLPPGSVRFESLKPGTYTGTLMKRPVIREQHSNFSRGALSDTGTNTEHCKGWHDPDVSYSAYLMCSSGNVNSLNIGWIALLENSHLENSSTSLEPRVALSERDESGITASITKRRKIPFTEFDFLQPDQEVHVGDELEFFIAQDTRISGSDAYEKCRATNIKVVCRAMDSAIKEVGLVTQVGSDGKCTIKCANFDKILSALACELQRNKRFRAGDEVEFYMFGNTALAVTLLPLGTVKFEEVDPTPISGTIAMLPGGNFKSLQQKGEDLSTSSVAPPSPSSNRHGIIRYKEFDDSDAFIEFDPKEMKACPLSVGDQVSFNSSKVIRNGIVHAVNLSLLRRFDDIEERGIVVSLKEHFGFLETEDHEYELFFHFSEFVGDLDNLREGDEVSYIVGKRQAKSSTKNVRKLPRGTIPAEIPIFLQRKFGWVTKSINTEIKDSPSNGVISYVEYGEDDTITQLTVPFSSSNVAGRKRLARLDFVSFILVKDRVKAYPRANDIVRLTEPERGKIETLSEQFGTIMGKEGEQQVLFHMNQVFERDQTSLAIGDAVEYFSGFNHAVSDNTKPFAFKIRRSSVAKVMGSSSPLSFSRQKFLHSSSDPSSNGMGNRNAVDSAAVDTTPKFIAFRAPRGPDGSPGFATLRTSMSLIQLADDSTP